MASRLFNGDYRPPTFDRGILGPDGEPYRKTVSDGHGGSATSRFARAFDIERGPESGMAVPHILTFSSILGSAFRNYYHGQYDEAMRFSREDAWAMRNDAYIRALIDERKYGVHSLKWHLEIDDPKDEWQKAVRDGVTMVMRRIPRWSDLTWSGLDAIWYGRAGDQIQPKWMEIDLPALPQTQTGGGLPTVSIAPAQGQKERRRALCIVNHLSVEGDKIDYDYDGNPYILITPLAASRLLEAGADVRKLVDGKWVQDSITDTDIVPHIKATHADIGYTTIGGRALYLKGTWRDRFRIHTHETLDTSFFQPWKASAVHGVGIRSVIFWYWWLRQEFLANVTDWCARTGLGVRIWYYEQGNAASEAAVDQAARDQTQQVNIKVPYTPGEQRPVLDFQETSGTGADLLLRIVKHVEDYLERYIVGQSVSGGGEDMSGFGDKGRSQAAERTKWHITRRDAMKFADTNTTDIVDLIKRWTYPDFADMPLRMVYDVDDPDVDKWVKGAKEFADMGGELDADEARARLGLSKPNSNSEIIGGLKQLQAQQATSGHIKPPDGLSPDGTAGADAGTESTNGQQNVPPAPAPSESALWRMQEAECKLLYSGEAQPFVREQLLEDYPPDALDDWMDQVNWTGPVAVPLDDIDFDNCDKWRASQEPEKVAKFAKKIKKGRMKPVLLIKKPGKDKYIVADGHHRTLAYRKLGRPLMAWVGHTPRNIGPWDWLHDAQYHGHGTRNEPEPQTYQETAMVHRYEEAALPQGMTADQLTQALAPLIAAQQQMMAALPAAVAQAVVQAMDARPPRTARVERGRDGSMRIVQETQP